MSAVPHAATALCKILLEFKKFQSLKSGEIIEILLLFLNIYLVMMAVEVHAELLREGI